MKKISELVKPYVAIIFGALLFLIYLNYLSLNDGALALGIIAVVFAGFYLAAGILGVILGEKIPSMLRKIFDLLFVVLFPSLMFAYFLIGTINSAGSKTMGPTAWVIVITGMSSSIGFAALYTVSKFVKIKIIDRLSYLFAAIFGLSLLLITVFDLSTGFPVGLGNIALAHIALYLIYGYMLFNSFSKVEEEPEVVEPEPVEEPEQKEEEQPAEVEQKEEQQPVE